MNTSIRMAVTALSIGAGAAGIAPAIAQESGGTATLSEIVVTAQRREERMQDVPLSIAALDSAAIEKAGIQDFADYATTVPGISFDYGQGPSGSRGRFTAGIRGVQRFSGLTDSTIGFYVDDTPIDLGANPTIIDVDRIEVLRGPQGTLYGAGSMGGTIRIITRQPDSSAFSGEADGTYSNTDHGGASHDVSGVVNLPLARGRAAMRIAGTYRDEAGFVDIVDRDTGSVLKSGADAQQTKAGRVSLLLTPTDRLSIAPGFFYQEYDLESEPEFVADGGLPEFSKNESVPTSSQVTTMVASLTLKYCFDFGELVSTTSRLEYDSKSQEDITETINAALFGLPDYLPSPVQNRTQRKSWTNEERLVSVLEGPMQYVVGAFFETSEAPFTSSSFIPGLNDAISPPLPRILPSDPRGDNLYDVNSTRDQKQMALFGELSYQVTERLDLTAGLRWFKYDADSTDAFSGYQFGGRPNNNPTIERAGSGSSSGVNPKGVLSFHLNDDNLLYVSVAKGFRAGGANIPLPTLCDANLIAAGITPPAPSEFEPDRLWSYEIGAKTMSPGRRLSIDAAAYYLNWSDLQLLVPLPTCRIQGYIANAGKARSLGAEMQVAGRPTEAITLGLSAAYLDSQLTEASTVLHAPSGTELLYNPKWTGSLSGEYAFPVGASLKGYARADVRYRDRQHLDYTGALWADSYTAADLRVGLGRDAWEVAVFGQNVTNASPNLSNTARSGLPGYYTFTVRPRTLGINLKVRF